MVIYASQPFWGQNPHFYYYFTTNFWRIAHQTACFNSLLKHQNYLTIIFLLKALPDATLETQLLKQQNLTVYIHTKLELCSLVVFWHGILLESLFYYDSGSFLALKDDQNTKHG